MQHEYLRRKSSFRKGLLALKDLSEKNGVSPETLGQVIIKQNQPKIEQYVRQYGAEPDTRNPVALAVQATLIHEKRIEGKMREKGIDDYGQAEDLVFAEDQESFSGGDENYQEFAPALLAVVAGVGKAGIEAINKNREKKGKKPILSGKFWQGLKDKTSGIDIDSDGDRLTIGVDGKPRKASDSDLSAAWDGARAELERQAKKDWIKQNLPKIAIAIVAIIAIVFFIKMYSKK